MRILWLSQYYPFPPQDGNALPIYEFVRRLAQRAQITLLTHFPAEAERIELGKRECDKWNVHLELVSRPALSRGVQFLTCLRSGIRWPNRFFSAPLAARTSELLGRASFDRVLS